MLTIREVIKICFNALLQRLKKHRGNWDQNDPSADDYIKNRPFYTDETKKIVSVPEQTITITNASPFTYLVLSESIEFVVGQTYEVKWDNKIYSCVAFDGDGIGVIGNQGMFGNGTDTGEPFIMMISKAEGMGMVIAPEAIGTHTVEVTSVKIVKIDKKYLPDLGLAPVATSGSYYDLEDTPIIYGDVVRYNTSQSLSAAQKTRARTNIGAVSSDEIVGVVKYTAQTLTDSQKQQARTNIDAVSSSEVTGVVRYTAQELTEEEKAQARANIGSVEISDIEKAKDYIALIDQVNGYTYLVSMRNGNLVSSIGVRTIDITAMPMKTLYTHGDYFDATGMVITATCYDGTVKEITDYVCPTAYLTEGTTSVEITYTEAGNTMAIIVPVTVSAFDPATVLIDFNYTDNSDGTYTITGWKGTYNGETSTEIIIPNNGCIIV